MVSFYQYADLSDAFLLRELLMNWAMRIGPDTASCKLALAMGEVFGETQAATSEKGGSK
jgi:hypothetical protein